MSPQKYELKVRIIVYVPVEVRNMGYISPKFRKSFNGQITIYYDQVIYL
ncbi:MAG: hypothetical protein H0X31_06165 [Nostocaceae cyanobacterium]|nr:hypothetical protein [Nostocaceae cyanobacterium]